MTTIADRGASSSPATDARAAVALALRLALGTSRPDDRDADWALGFDAASRELLVPLAWTRSGQRIRDHAPPAIASAWRRGSLAAHLRGQQQLDFLRTATAALIDAGIDPVVLKGMPLGERLYGDAFVRCSADIDLYVPAAQRARAGAALRFLGWRSIEGEAPWHETWSLWRDEVEWHLELHSSLVSDHLAHLRVAPPAATAAWVGGHLLCAHTGPFVAPYLAAHLATHQMAPLLWLVDFATLWHASSADARVQSERAAREAGLDRYLRWACERAELLEPAARGDADALGALGIGSARRRDVHSIWRHVRLAASTGDRLQVALAFLAPRVARRNVRSLARYTIARLRTRLRSVTGTSREYTTGRAPVVPAMGRESTSGRALRLDRDDMLSLTGDVIGAGGALWIRAPGGSMLPTIPRRALVRVRGVPTEGIAKGDVVLALTTDGEPVLHRAVVVRDDHIVMRGDAAIRSDPIVPLSRVIGVATHVKDGAEERALGRSPGRSIGVAMLKLRRRVERVVRRAR